MNVYNTTIGDLRCRALFPALEWTTGVGQAIGRLPGQPYGALHVSVFNGHGVGGRLGMQVYLGPAGWTKEWALLATTEEPPTEAVFLALMEEARRKLESFAAALTPAPA